MEQEQQPQLEEILEVVEIEIFAIEEKPLPHAKRYIIRVDKDKVNVALFGMTAAQWRQANPQQPGNMRDVATLEQLVVLSNLESINAVLIHQGLTASGRLAQLNAIAISQMRSLIGATSVKRLGKPPER